MSHFVVFSPQSGVKLLFQKSGFDGIVSFCEKHDSIHSKL